MAKKPHGGWRRHIRMARNGAHDAYGADIGAPDWQVIPYLEDGMKLKATSERFEANSSWDAEFDRAVAVQHQQNVRGAINTMLYPEIAQFLLDAGIQRVASAGSNYQDTYKHKVQHFTPPDPREYYGVCVDTLTLTVSMTGDRDARVTLDCIGQREIGVDGLSDSDFVYTGEISPRPFMGSYCDIKVNGATVTDVEQFTLTVAQNHGDGPATWNAEVNAGVLGYCKAGLRRISLALTKLNDDAAMNRAIRDGDLLTFECALHHPDGHLAQIILPALYVPESDENGTPDQQAKESPRLEALVAASGTHAGKAIVYGVDLAADGTTTLAPLTTTTGAATSTTGAPTTTPPE